MANSKKSQKEKTNAQRSNRFTEEFVIQIGRLTEFYKIVQLLNNMAGHGNWTTRGRPVRRLRRVDSYNRISFFSDRKMDITFCLPAEHSYISSRLLLEL